MAISNPFMNALQGLGSAAQEYDPYSDTMMQKALFESQYRALQSQAKQATESKPVEKPQPNKKLLLLEKP